MNQADRFPPQIRYIVGNEVCERFSFYGMRAILTIFMVQYLLLTSETATSVYHIFISACYLMPLAGAFLADRFFGKYWVIFWLSVVYCLGHAVIALFENQQGLYWGLALIAIGSGGIKPCVSAFVGDQFLSHQKELIKKVYNLFYWIINLGSATSSLLTPVLLVHYGPSVAFGIPGVLMLIATWIFWLGRKQYVHKPPTGANPHSFSRVLVTGLRGRFQGVGFWSAAAKLHPPESLTAVRSVLSIMLIFFTAVPVFWSLFDQKGSTWVLQARSMNPQFLGFTIQPSQLQFLNPWMVMILIPLFVYVIYPAINRIYDFTPLRRMGTGMVIASLAYVQVALIQFQLDGGSQLNIAWQFFPYLTITVAEVMISITGLEFAYTQAPPSMKSTIMSLWMLTTFLGNVLVTVVAKLNVFEGGFFFLFFAGLMLVVAGVFTLMARRYVMKST